MALEILAAALVAVAIAGVALATRPEATRRWFARIQTARKTVFRIIAVLAAVVLLGTGSPLLMLAGFLILVYAALVLFVEEPHREVLEWIDA